MPGFGAGSGQFRRDRKLRATGGDVGKLSDRRDGKRLKVMENFAANCIELRGFFGIASVGVSGFFGERKKVIKFFSLVPIDRGCACY